MTTPPVASSTFSQNAATLASTVSIAKPSDLSDGCVQVVVCLSSAATTWSPPVGGGFTSRGSGGQTAWYTKPIPSASAEPSSYNFTTSGNGNLRIYSFKVTGADTTTPIQAASWAQTTGSSHAGTSVTATKADSLLLTATTTAGSGVTNPVSTGLTPLINDNTSFRKTTESGTVGAGATGAKTYTTAVSAVAGVGQMVFNPPASKGNVVVSGAKVPVVDMSVIVSGVKVPVVSASVIVSGAKVPLA